MTDDALLCPMTKADLTADRVLAEITRLACGDLRAWYLMASQAQPGRKTSQDLNDWFWQRTALARLIGAVAGALADHPETTLRLLAGRGLVPRAHLAALLPTTDPERLGGTDA